MRKMFSWFDSNCVLKYLFAYLGVFGFLYVAFLVTNMPMTVKARKTEAYYDSYSMDMESMQEHDGDIVEVKGVVWGVNVSKYRDTPLKDSCLVILDGSVYCWFNKNNVKECTGLREGDYITVKGKLDISGSYINLKSCCLDF